ncbi:MAG: ATPase, T2SS/T4P/T4SS family [Bdellovibrionota bacterium]
MSRTKIHDFLDEIAKRTGITEVIINRPDNVFVEKDGELIKLETKFRDEEIEAFCQDVALFNRKTFGPATPILDGSLTDGSRINLIHKDYTNTHHAITIRRYLKSIKTFADAPGIFGLSEEWVEFLKMLVKARVNIIVSGGTGVGKTTFLNLLLQEMDPKERVITIEDTRELQFSHTNTVRLEARPTQGGVQGLAIRDLLKNTLRMRPDRIIVGEVRGGEVFDLLQAMNTGHEGSMTSVHSNSPGECLGRLENLFLLSGYELPLKALRYQISSAVDYIIQIRRNKNGDRVVQQLTELAGMEGDRILMQDIGIMKDDNFTFSGAVPSNVARLQKAGLPKDFFTNF